MRYPDFLQVEQCEWVSVCMWVSVCVFIAKHGWTKILCCDLLWNAKLIVKRWEMEMHGERRRKERRGEKSYNVVYEWMQTLNRQWGLWQTWVQWFLNESWISKTMQVSFYWQIEKLNHRHEQRELNINNSCNQKISVNSLAPSKITVMRLHWYCCSRFQRDFNHLIKPYRVQTQTSQIVEWDHNTSKIQCRHSKTASLTVLRWYVIQRYKIWEKANEL